ncbi:MAG TPA: glycosyltransferase family 39 protein [Geminicoccaceae bacterium]|nr:glycosyltransferase family 39 protein [Geminicoccaceae bacterium]
MTQQWTRRDVLALLAVAALALTVRLAALPFATTAGSNPAARVWIAWKWLDDPGVITHGVWGPLHFYLIGAVLALTGDPVTAPILLHVLFGVGSAVLLYILVRIEFTGPNSALLAALAFAVYPVGLSDSVSVRAEAPFVFFVLASMLLLALARTRASVTVLAGAAGLMLTLASMLRYEGWMLTPLLAMLLWPRIVPILVFLVVASVFPVFWMIGNLVAYGDPFYGVSYAQSWELESMGRAAMPLAEGLRTAIGFLFNAARGLTPLLALLALVGGLLALLRHRRVALWLIPPAGLLALLAWSVANGTLVPKVSYTAMVGTMALPFVALAFQELGAERWRAAVVGVAAVAMVGVVALSSCASCLRAAGLEILRSPPPYPSFENQVIARDLSEIVARNLGEPPAGIVSDFYGYDGTDWVLLLSRTHPDRIFLAPWAPNQPLDENGLEAFAQAHPEGLLIMRPGSRFAGQIDLDGERDTAEFAGHPVRIEEVASVAWPENDWHPLDAEDVGEERIVVYRYKRADMAGQVAPGSDGASRD